MSFRCNVCSRKVSDEGMLIYNGTVQCGDCYGYSIKADDEARIQAVTPEEAFPFPRNPEEWDKHVDEKGVAHIYNGHEWKAISILEGGPEIPPTIKPKQTNWRREAVMATRALKDTT
jgi:hypothetical protein